MLNRRPRSRRRLARLAACVPVAWATTAAHASPTTRPAYVSDETPEAEAANVAMSRDLSDYSQRIARPEIWRDPRARDEAAKTLVPQIRRTEAEAATLGRLDPKLTGGSELIARLCSVDRAALGDADAVAQLQQRRSSADPAVALLGECDAIRMRWRQAGNDPAKQSAVAASAQALAGAHPDQDDVFDCMYGLSMRAVTPELRTTLGKVATGMESPHAKRFRQSKDKTATARLAGQVGKPLALAGKLPDGAPFTTAAWKGKVVLVDFWATWCGPCKAELPRVKEMYLKYHTAGLEVVGVDNDFTVEAVTSYAAKNDLPWPQLIDAPAAAASEANPLNKQLGVTGIPVMMLIDRKGNCRSVTARDDMEEQIPALLKEPS